MKFDLWIEIKKSDYTDNWNVCATVHRYICRDEKFFIEGAPIDVYFEQGKEYKNQTFHFNKLLLKEILKLLFPGNGKNLLNIDRQKAWDYYHYTLYEGFTFNVHPISISNTFFRQSFKGTQEEIYQKCLDINKKWLK